MLQAKQIGKYRPYKTRAEALIGRTCVTPSGEHYSLIAYEKVGRSHHWVYKWTDCPESILNQTTNILRSKTQLGICEISEWISALRALRPD
jgi:hypothetical protein